MMEYKEFLESRKQRGADCGFEPTFVPDFLFDFQKFLVNWSVLKGRCANFDDCGLGKTPMQLVWAENIARHCKKPVLILAPLAVSYQTKRESDKFGIDCYRSIDGSTQGNIVITNYEKLCYFKPDDFSGVACDESSILKNFDGAIKSAVTDFMRKVQYRSLWTATAAPNDYIELGTSSEALGYLGFMDMMNRFFKNDRNNSTNGRRFFGEAPKWRFKGHAELPFWRWVTSWARACRKPSDLGFDDGKFKLTKLIENEHLVEAETLPDGYFLPIHASNLPEQREEKRRTINERCERVLSIVKDRTDQSLIWCQLNDEAAYLKKVIPDSVEISGSDSDEKKEAAFIGFQSGQIKRLITKPKIGAWGMNWQNACHATYFPDHSYERYYQLVRREWRFGQTNDVTIDIVLTEGERKIMKNLQRKNIAAAKMFENLVAEMNNSIGIQQINKFTQKEIIPSWL